MRSTFALIQQVTGPLERVAAVPIRSDDKTSKRADSTQEALNIDNQKETALTPDNYAFTLQAKAQDARHVYYVLNADPKRKNKFLFHGTVWIDAQDFAVAKIVAEPAKNPSLWISKTAIEHHYVKVGEFWLPAQNISKTNVRLGGVATLTIDYGDYEVQVKSPTVA